MAVVLGIYERLIMSVRATSVAVTRALRGDFGRARRWVTQVEWLLVVPLLCGVLASVALLASFIETQLSERPTEIAGLFMGLVAASTVAACRLYEWRRPGYMLLSVAVAVAAFAGLGVQGGQVESPSLMALLGAGAIAVCAMILPGISGAFVLLMLGMYPAVLHAVDEVLLADVAVLALGAAAGLAVFSSLLAWLLERFRTAVMSVLVGLLAGSMRVLWPWPNGVGVTGGDRSSAVSVPVSGTDLAWPSANEWLAPTAAAAAGFAVVVLLTHLSGRFTPSPPA